MRPSPLLLLALLLAPAPAAAYIDPGTGSYAFQVIVATIAGSLYVISQYWKRLLALFAGKPETKDEAKNAENAPPPEPPGGSGAKG